MQIVRVRFPRTDDKDMIYLAQIRAKYLAPPYNPRTDGSWNPADGVLSDLMKYSRKHLRKLCKKHALKHTGPRRKLIKRMYLHWRASKFHHMGISKGNEEHFGYGKGYESTRTPTCPCGMFRRSDDRARRKRREEIREIQKRDKAYFKAPRINRFPRFPLFPRDENGIVRFPRLADDNIDSQSS